MYIGLDFFIYYFFSYIMISIRADSETNRLDVTELCKVVISYSIVNFSYTEKLHRRQNTLSNHKHLYNYYKYKYSLANDLYTYLYIIYICNNMNNTMLVSLVSH